MNQQLQNVFYLLNEFTTEFMPTYCFPVLFPTSEGDFTRKCLRYDVDWAESIKHLLRFSYTVNDVTTYPFSENKLFIFWAYNLIERHRLLTQTKVFLTKEIDITGMTIDKLNEILADNYKSKKLIEKCLKYTANVRGNASYWHSVKGSLQNIIEQKGAPNIFFTFSSAEPYWADLAQLFTTDLPTDWCKKMLSLQNYTSLIDWFFMKRFTSFIKILFHKIYPSEWYWYRIDRIDGSDRWIGSMDRIDGSDRWIGSMDSPGSY